MPDFTGKVALVTGGTSGIGRATALAFAKAGARVAVSGRRAAEGAETVRLVEAAGGEALFVACDVSDGGAVQSMVRAVTDAFGRLDVAFNNAGIAPAKAPLAEQDEALFDRVVAVNLKGTWLSMKYEIPAMLASGGGAIVNNSSIAGLVAFPGLASYHATKHGVLGLTKSAALDYAKAGIRINAVCPGFIATDMLAGLLGGDEAMNKAMPAAQPIGRGGTVDEVAAAVLWLASSESSLMTAQHVVLDGGKTATA